MEWSGKAGFSGCGNNVMEEIIVIDKEVIKKVVEQVQAMDYGDTLTHQQLAADLEIKYPSNEYRSAISKVQSECLERGKMLENIVKIGYRITAPDDYSSRALRQYKQGARRISRGQKMLDYAPIDKMSQNGLMQYRNIKDRSSALAEHLSGAIVELRLLQKQHPLKLGK